MLRSPLPAALACMARPEGSELGRLNAEFELLYAQRESIVKQQTELGNTLRDVDKGMRVLQLHMAELRAVAVSRVAIVSAKPVALTGHKWRVRINSAIVGRGDVYRITLNMLIPSRVRSPGDGMGKYFKFPGSIHDSTYSWDPLFIYPEHICDDGKIRFLFEILTSDDKLSEVTLEANKTDTAPIDIVPYGRSAASSSGRTLGIEVVDGKRHNVI